MEGPGYRPARCLRRTWTRRADPVSRLLEERVCDVVPQIGRERCSGQPASRLTVDLDHHAGADLVVGLQAHQPGPPVSRQKGLAADESLLFQMDEAAQSRRKGRHGRGDVGPVVENAGLDAADVHAGQGGEAQAVSAADPRQVVPQPTVISGLGHVDLEPDLARPAGAGREEGFARHRDPGHTEIGEGVGRTAVGKGRQHLQGARPLDLQHPVPGVDDLHVESRLVCLEPAEDLAVRQHVAEAILGQTHEDAVHQDAAIGGST